MHACVLSVWLSFFVRVGVKILGGLVPKYEKSLWTWGLPMNTARQVVSGDVGSLTRARYCFNGTPRPDV